jgi:hypothetical protein
MTKKNITLTLTLTPDEYEALKDIIKHEYLNGAEIDTDLSKSILNKIERGGHIK